MKVTVKDTYTILEDEYDDVIDFAAYLERVIPDKYKDLNLVIDLLKYDKLNLEQLSHFIKLSNSQREERRSFVFVNKDIDFDLIPNEAIVVPTLQEAIDIIEMEEIERDLGF